MGKRHLPGLHLAQARFQKTDFQNPAAAGPQTAGVCQAERCKLKLVLSSEDLPEHKETILQTEEEEEEGRVKGNLRLQLESLRYPRSNVRP